MPNLVTTDAFSFLVGYGWLLILLCMLLATWGRRLYRFTQTLPGYAPTPKLSRVLSKWVGSRDLDLEAFLTADNAPAAAVETRRHALQRLIGELTKNSEKSSAYAQIAKENMSDLRFADANRVPFPFAKVMRDSVNLASIADHSEGPYIVDPDSNRYLDVSGSYGVNVAGYDRYKEWLAKGMARVADLGPVLGPLHPIVTENTKILKSLSGQEEVSFHTSGTEAVMAAVRLARFNTGRKKIVCFSGAYHGWWDGVQPGLGSERSIDDCLTLNEMKAGSLKVIRRRRNEIAGILINPVQSFHPNSPPPNDAVLLSTDIRKTAGETVDDPRNSAYGRWLVALRELCDECDIPLIFDEVYSGFRLAPGGAQEHYGVQADLTIYGKTIAAGLPIGVVCGSRKLMRRFDPNHPMRIAYVVGTFSAYPQAMGTMYEFLQWVTSAEARAEYEQANERCQSWIETTNERMGDENLPLKLTNLGTIWTIEFTEPSRFSWLLQYYLRAQYINLSWVGTGRCLVSLDYTDEEFQLLTQRIVHAAKQMYADKWWLTKEEQPMKDKEAKAGMVKDLARSVVPMRAQSFYAEVMRRKHDDHVASHSDRTNQFLHFVSSSVFIYCYWLIFSDLVAAMWLGLGALFIRQIGHALIEPPCHDAEQLLLGFDTRSKSVIVAIYLLIPLVNSLAAPVFNWTTITTSIAAATAWQWFWFTALVIFGRVILLIRRHGLNNALVWFVKLITDPITDIKAYYRSAFQLLSRQPREA